MENGSALQEEVKNGQQGVVIQVKSVQHRKYRFFVITFFIFLIVGLFVFLITKQLPNEPVLLPQPSVSIQKQSKFETTQTKIASSLEVTSLYPNVKWQDITETSKDSDINVVYVDGEITQIAFKGSFWETVVSDTESSFITSYYSDELEKKGWVINATPLKFNELSLIGLIADAPCGGVKSFIGYKDGLVRVVSISHELASCISLSLSPTPSKYFTTYTLFISEPMRLEEISNYRKTQLEEK